MYTQDPQKAEFQVRVTLYDTVNHWFFGSTWIGPLILAEDVLENRIKVAYNEVITKIALVLLVYEQYYLLTNRREGITRAAGFGFTCIDMQAS